MIAAKFWHSKPTRIGVESSTRTDVPNENYNVNGVLGWVGFDIDISMKDDLK